VKGIYMRVAVVGTGFARQVHLPGYLMVDGVELAAVCDNRPGRAKQVAEEFGIGRWCEEFDDVLGMALRRCSPVPAEDGR
jgi:predicted dehydrogenase